MFTKPWDRSVSKESFFTKLDLISGKNLLIFAGVLMWSAITFADGLEIKKQSNHYIIENQYIKLVVNPAHGGRIEQFINKTTGTPLTVSYSNAAAPAGSGIGIERMRNSGGGTDRNFEKTAYIASIKEKTSAKCTLELKCTRKNIEVKKFFTLHKDRNSVDINYQILNHNKQDIVAQLWITNVIYPDKKPKELRFYFPAGNYTKQLGSSSGNFTNKVLSYFPGTTPKEPNNVMHSTIDGWTAVLDNKGNGAGIETDYPLFDCFYNFHALSSPWLPTIEWLSRRFILPSYEAGVRNATVRPELEDPLKRYIYKTGWKLLPLENFSSVNGIKDGIAVSLNVNNSNLKITLSADRKLENITASLFCEKLGGAAKLLKSFSGINLAPGKNIELNLNSPSLNGNRVFYLKLADKNGKLASFEIPKLEEKAYTNYKPAPAAAKNKFFDPRDAVAELGSNFEDECISWALPLKKKLKVLAIYQWRSHREMSELNRRADLDLTLVEINRPHVFSFSRSAFCSHAVPDPKIILKAALKKDYDVILIAGAIYWHIIPEAFRNAIVSKVKKGTGLVCVCPHWRASIRKMISSSAPGSDYILRGIPFKNIPGLSKLKTEKRIVQAGMLGKGRVVFLKYSVVPKGKIWRVAGRAVCAHLEGNKFYSFPTWEYYFSLAARALVYAANRTPEITISGNKSNSVEITNKTGKPQDVDFNMEVFNKRWRKVDTISKKLALKPGNNPVKFTVGKEKYNLAGTYFYNVSLRQNGKVADWYSFTEDVAKQCSISAIKLDKFGYEPDMPVKLSLKLEGNIAGTTLRVSLLDVYNRVFGNASSRLTNNDLDITVRNKVLPLSVLCRLKVEIIKDNKVIDNGEKYFTVNIPDHKDVKFIIWGATEGSHWTQKLAMKQYTRIGFDWCTGFQIPSATKADNKKVGACVLASGMRFMPLCLHRFGVHRNGTKSLVRKPCLRDPDYLRKMKKEITNYVNWLKDFFPPYYFVGDENSLGFYSAPHDFCHSKFCMAGFRIWLKKKYDSLAALNQAWKSSFKTWGQIKPFTLAEAKKSGNFASWTDHRCYMFTALAFAIDKEKQALVSADKNGRLAVSGMGEPLVHNGFNWYLMEQSLDLVVAYLRRTGRVMDPMRSFGKKRNVLLSAWNGYKAPPDTINWRHWHQVSNCFFAPAYWWGNYLLNHGDHTLSDEAKQLKATFAAIKNSGIGKLMVDAEMSPSRFGVLYSVPSLVATEYSATKCRINTTTYKANLDGWSCLLRDCGFQPPTYLMPVELEEKLTPERFPVFILPLVMALDDKSIRILEKYVKDGGILVADAYSGILHTNSNIRKNNPLEKVFGIKNVVFMTGIIKDSISIKLDGKDMPIPVKPFSRIKLDGGTALGHLSGGAKVLRFGGMTLRESNKNASVPSFIINRIGKGAAIYLNASFDEYEQVRINAVQSRKVVDALRGVFTDAKLKLPQASIPAGSEIVSHETAGNTYLAMTRRPGSDRNVNDFKINLPVKKYVYDVRNKKFLGCTKVITGELDPGKSLFFALMPAEIKSFRMSAVTCPEGIRVKTSINSNKAPLITSVVRIELSGPDGRIRPEYSRNYSIKGGFDKIIKLGLNEFNGKWKIKAIEAISGKCLEQNINFRK